MTEPRPRRTPAPRASTPPAEQLPGQDITEQQLPDQLAESLLESEIFAATASPRVTELQDSVIQAAPSVPVPGPSAPTQPAPIQAAPVQPAAVQPASAAPGRPPVSPVIPGALSDDEPVELIDELKPMYSSAAPFLARFLPQAQPVYQGLRSPYCDLHTFLKYLHDQSWHGYLHAELGDQSAYVLVYEGRTVSAAATGATGEQALGEMLSLYEQGAELTGYPLTATLAHVLSGVGSRAWKFNLTEDFTGLHARPTGAIFYARGEIVATMTATLPYEGAFPAPLRPQTLILPRSLAGWAHHTYSPTLRGRDAINAITDVYLAFKSKYGQPGLGLMRAIVQNQTPAEYAMREDVALHEIEPLLQDFLKTGYLRDE